MGKSPNKESQDFSLRLKRALKRSAKKVETPAELALQFNLRHPGEPITPQAVQKWLSGAAKPTAGKIDTLANWLNVSPQWLRYGIAETKPEAAHGGRKPKGRAASAAMPTPAELKLVAKILSLPGHQRYLVSEIIEQFALEQEMWKD